MGGSSKDSGLTLDQRSWFERHAKKEICNANAN